MRRLGNIALAIASGALTLGAFAVAAWLLLVPWAVEEYARQSLRAAGIEGAEMDVRRIWRDGATIGPLSADAPAFVVRRLDVDWSLGRLIEEGRVDRLAVSGIRVPLGIDQQGAIALGGLDLPDLIDRFAGAAEGGPTAPGPVGRPPFDDLAVDDVAIALDSFWQTALIPARVTAHVDEDGVLSGVVDFTVDTPVQSLAARLAGEWSPDGSVSGEVTVNSDQLAYAGVQLGDVDGWVTLSAPAGGALAVDGWLGADAVRWGGRDWGRAEVLYRGDPSPISLYIRLLDPEGAYSLAVDLAQDGGAWQANAALQADRLEETARLLPAGATPPLAGRGTLTANARFDRDAVDAAMAGEIPDLPPIDVTLEVREGQWGDIADGIAANLAGRLSRADGNWVLTGSGPSELAGTVAAVGGSARLTLAPMANREAWRIGFGPQSGSISLSGDVSLRGEDNGEIRIGGEMEYGDGTIALDAVRVRSIGATIGDLAVPNADLRLDGTGRADALDLTARGSAVLSGSIAGITADRLAATIDLSVAGTSGAPIVFGGDGCQQVTLHSFDIGGVVFAAGAEPEDWCVRQDAAEDAEAPPLFAWRDASPLITARLAGPDEAIIAVDGTPVSLSAPRITFAGNLSSAATTLNATAARSAEIGISIEQVAANGTLVILDPWGFDGTVDADRLVIDGRPVVPVSVSATIAAGPQAISLDGTASYAGIGLPVTLEQDLLEGGGEVRVTIPGLRFRADGLQPSGLVPALAFEAIDSFSGTVSGQAVVGWDPDLSTSATLRLSDFGLTRPGVEVSGVNGTIRLYSLDPPRMAEGQSLSVASVDAGLLLSSGMVTVGLGSGNVLTVQSAGFDWAGGRMTAEPFSYDLDGDAVSFILAATGIELERLLQEFPVEGLNATGTLDGRIPISLRGDTIEIDDGRLATRGPGVIRYRPDDRPNLGGGENIDLLFDAVRNFQYESAVVTLNGTTAGDLAMGLNIRGANPDVYDGYPIALNVNVSGALDDILREGLEVLSIGDRTRDYFQDEAIRGRLDGFWDEQ